jgi:hypothetical protein
MTVLTRGLRPRTPSSFGSLALARPTGHAARFLRMTVLTRGLRPRTPSSFGSLALARPTGQELRQ